jgi:uncharacterized protein HemY
VSRRAIFTAPASLPLLVAAPAAAAALAACLAWLTRSAEISRLLVQWGDLEAWLAENHRWFELSDAERRSLPEAAGLAKIDRQLDALTHERDGLLECLPAIPALTREAPALKLEVAATLVDVADLPDAHALIRSSIRDLRTIAG